MRNELVNCYGVSGAESPVRNCLKTSVEPFCDKLLVDNLGNLIVYKKGKGKKNNLLLTVPMDEPGIIVTKITENGYLKFDIIGRLRPEFLVFKQVLVNGIPGIIGLKAVHLTTKSERTRPVKADELFVDIGAESFEEASRVVTVGDCGVVDSPCRNFGIGMMKGRAIGSRLACNLAAELLQEELPIDLEVVFSVQREIGSRGIRTALTQTKAEIGVALEGVAGKPGDGVLLTQHTDPQLRDELTNLAIKEEISLTPCVSKEQGQESALIQSGRNVISLGIPVRYMESASQVASVADAEMAKRLLKLYMEELS